MAKKCNGCGKFSSASVSIKCARCSHYIHRTCTTNVSPVSKVPKWICKGCKPKACSPVVTKDSKWDCPLDTPSIESSLPFSKQTAQELNIAGSFMEQIKLLRSELIAVTQEVSSFRQDISSLRSTLIEVGKRVDKVEERLAVLEEKSSSSTDSHLMKDIAQLKADLNERNQAELLNDRDISGIPERSGENLQHIVDLITTKLGVKLDERDVVYVERLGPRPPYTVTGESPRPRSIVVRLVHRAVRDKLLRAARVRRGADTSDFDLDFEPARFYINERLTRSNRLLFHKAREEGRQNNWRYIWTRNGRIYARHNKDTVVHRIRVENDVVKIFCTR
ncbi:unnamed protein product [Euphydryas editha]|uniref:Phorbol-ester/DAG-type domain-containing protein n=1 Tax=Euphydryas editha TaxID=104508 RepID=A0AAU9V348_EUPED|nr:unnamed protein product [Euphydryas editha]